MQHLDILYREIVIREIRIYSQILSIKNGCSYTNGFIHQVDDFVENTDLISKIMIRTTLICYRRFIRMQGGPLNMGVKASSLVHFCNKKITAGAP